MKKNKVLKILLCVALAGAAVGLFAGCGSGGGSQQGSGGSSDDKVIKVGATPAPHAEILGQIKGDLEKEGYTLEIVEFSDYIQPNVALTESELDANYFQHITYLNNYNDENGTDLASAAGIHFEPLGLYAGKTSSISALPDGAKIAVPSDPTNEARALLLLQDLGLIKLKDGAGIEATKNDIADNPKKIEIIETEAASLPRALQDVDMAVINGNYAIGAGLDPNKAVASEKTDSEAAEKYVNVIAVRPADKDSEKIKALVKALETEKVRDYIESTYEGSVVPLF